MTHSKSIAAVTGALAIVLSALTFGCGSSEPSPLSAAAFADQANAICRQAMDRREADLEAASNSASKSGGESEAELDEFVVEVALPPVQSMAEELDGLGPPEKDEQQVEDMIGALEEGVEKSEADPLKAVSGAAFNQANSQAEAYGLNDCVV